MTTIISLGGWDKITPNSDCVMLHCLSDPHEPDHYAKRQNQYNEADPIFDNFSYNRMIATLETCNTLTLRSEALRN